MSDLTLGVAPCRACGNPIRRATHKHIFCKSCIPFAKAIAQATHKAVKLAIEFNQLPPAYKKRCADCGCVAELWNHRSYASPLDVEPVCGPCNFARDPATDVVELVKQAISARQSHMAYLGTIPATDVINLPDRLAEFETGLINGALEKTHQDKRAAASLLSIPLTDLEYRLKRLKNA